MSAAAATARATQPAASAATQSASPAAVSRLAPWRPSIVLPARVMVGRPIHSASQVVVPPGKGVLSISTSTSACAAR
jgi:hypothetical protein